MKFSRSNFAVIVLLCMFALTAAINLNASTFQDNSVLDKKSFQFSGAFAEYPNSNFHVILDYDPNNRLSDRVVAEGTTDSKGCFQSKLELDESQAFVLLIDRSIYRLWGEPGSDLVVTKPRDTAAICSGSLSNLNQFLLENRLATSKANQANEEFSPTAFLKTIDERLAAQLQQLQEFQNEIDGHRRFLDYSNAQIIASAANLKNTRAQFAIRNKTLKKEDLPKDYFQFWNAFPILGDNDAMLCRQYQLALRNKFGYLAKQVLINEGVDPNTDPARWIGKELEIQGKQLSSSPHTHELLYADKIMFMIQYMETSDTIATLAEFTKLFPASSYLQTINEAFAKTQNVDLTAIDKACAFVDAEGKSVSFSELKDKVVYIDFWGLWCKGCVTQQPDLEKLIDKFSDSDDVVFLSIDFHDSMDNWKGFVRDEKPKGLHWKPSTPSDETEAAKLFTLASFPRYMIFGKEGNLVSASAPIPSANNLEKMLRECARSSQDK